MTNAGKRHGRTKAQGRARARVLILLHPFRWTRLFFQAMLGTLPVTPGQQVIRAGGRVEAGGGPIDADDDREDEGYDGMG